MIKNDVEAKMGHDNFCLVAIYEYVISVQFRYSRSNNLTKVTTLNSPGSKQLRELDHKHWDF